MAVSSVQSSRYRRRLLALLKEHAYREGRFTLASGREASYYINCKEVTLRAEGVWLVARLFFELMGRERFDAVGGPTLGADPILGAMASMSVSRRQPLAALIVRKEAKGHGAGKLVEGPTLRPGARVLALEDVTTTGASLERAVLALRDCGYQVTRACSIVDRQDGGRERLAAIGCRLRSLFTGADFQAC